MTELERAGLTPAEKFFDVIEEYCFNGIEPLGHWDTEDLLDLQEAVADELHSRDEEAQHEWFMAQET